MPLSLVLFLLVFGACSDSAENNKDAESEVLGDKKDDQGESDEEKTEISPEVVSDLINSIPSPIETSQLIKEAGTDFDEEMLNSANNAGQYNTNFKRAANLGVYGTDLGFANIYGQQSAAIDYLSAVREMAEGLQIGQFFDFKTIRKLASNSSNVDSLLMTTTQNFEKINQHLQKKKRANLSMLIIVGGWVEGLHLTCQVLKQKKHDQLKERVGEQKIVLDQLSTLMKAFEGDPKIERIEPGMEDLKAAYEPIVIETVYGDSKMVEVDGVMTFKQESKTTIYISDQQLQKITKAAAELRNQLVSAS